MRTLGFPIVLAAMLATTAKADFINSQVICASSGGTITATNFCNSVGDFGTSATASVNASFTLPTSPGPLSLMSSGQGFAKGYNDGTNNNRSAAYNESISIQLTLDTPGSPRPGFYLITGHSSPLAGPDTKYVESIFGYSLPFPGVPLRELPITLGQPFTFTYTQSMSCYDENLNFFCGTNSFSSQFDFHLYEADGVTPVLITLAAPEPSTATLLFLP
ncbi:MAG TPA: hypothetical protein VH369_13050 [Bryobacteraceae bacterium]|jgi:hypothetical protein